MTSVPGEPIRDDEPNEPGPGEPEPERKPLNGAGWLGIGLSGAAFLSSVAVGWSGAILVAAIGSAFALNGLVRANRGRATNGRYAFAGLILAVVTIGLAFFWSARAEPCRPLIADETKYTTCYAEHAGIF